MGGKFQFTREVPQPIGPSVNFESRRKSFEVKKKRSKQNEHELEVLHKVTVVNESSRNDKK